MSILILIVVLLGLANRHMCRVAQTNVFEVMFRMMMVMMLRY